jgi:translation initiation factor IF-2
MFSTTVAEFANELKKSTATLLEQLQSAGVAKTAASDKLNDADKQRLLSYLQSTHGAAGAERKKITLVKKSTTEIKQADASGKARTIQVEVRKKRTFIRRDDGVEVSAEASVPESEQEVEAVPQIDHVELARREEEARRQAELIRRQEEELSERRRQREEQEVRAREASEKAAAVAAEAAAAQALKKKSKPVAPEQTVPNATEIEAAKVLAATQKEQDLAIEKGLAREKELVESKARAAEDVARAADLGDRRRKAENEAAAIRLMMSSPAKKAPPPPKKPEEVKPAMKGNTA